MATDEELGRRFPALASLGRLGRQRRIPVIAQMTATECGAACLAMTLAYHGREVSLDELRTFMGVGRDGASALAILDAARAHGLTARGVKVDVDELELLPVGSVLHWEFNHFIVFERLNDDSVEVVDPAMGRRKLSLADFGRSFTGVALLLEPSDSFQRVAGKRRSLFAQLGRVTGQAGQWSRIVVVSVLLQLFALALPILTGAVVDRVVPRGDGRLLAVLAAGTAGLVGFNFLASMVRAHLLITLRTIFDARMTLGFLDHLLRLPYAYFQRRSAGDLMMRVNSNATIREMLTSGVLSTLLDGGLVIIYLALLFVADRSFALVVLSLAALQMVVLLFAQRQQQELLSATLHTQAKSEGYLVELLAGIETLKVTGSELRAGERWSTLFVDQLNVSLQRSRLQALVDSLNGTLRVAGPLVILGYGAWQALSGTLTLGQLMSLSALGNAFLTPLSNLVTTGMQLQLVGKYVERIEDVLDAAPEQPPGETRLTPTLRGAISLERVSFSYSANSPLVVRDVSVEIAPGQLVAIVGKSGSGKSTLASMLVGLYQPTSGAILFDGVDLSRLDIPSLRRQLGIVNQRAYLFGSSIRANIALSEPGLPMERVVQAAEQACIDAEIRAMPMGYETLLLDAGASLSGGQRQRVALARALARRPAILLLDEATSALDAVTERAVQDQLSSLRCTRVVIAHRLSTIRQADQILVMDEGRIVERGTHGQLLALGGYYARLIAAQMESGT